MEKRRNPVIEVRALAYQAQFGRFTIAVVTVVEVVMGYHQVGRPELAQQFMRAYPRWKCYSLRRGPRPSPVPSLPTCAASAGRLAGRTR